MALLLAYLVIRPQEISLIRLILTYEELRAQRNETTHEGQRANKFLRQSYSLTQLLNIYHLRGFEETFSLQLRKTVLSVSQLSAILTKSLR